MGFPWQNNIINTNIYGVYRVSLWFVKASVDLILSSSEVWNSKSHSISHYFGHFIPSLQRYACTHNSYAQINWPIHIFDMLKCIEFEWNADHPNHMIAIKFATFWNMHICVSFCLDSIQSNQMSHGLLLVL